MTSLRSLLQRLLPAHLRDGEPGRRTLILVVALLAALVGTVAVGIWQRLAGSPLIGLIYLAGSGAAVALFAVLHLTGSWRLSGHLFVTAWTVIFTTVAVFRGGLWTSPMLLMAVAPLLAAAILGARAGMIWTAAVMVATAVLGSTEVLFGITLIDRLPPERVGLARTIGALVFVAFAAAVIWALQTRVRMALAEAEQAERERVLADTEAQLLRTERMAAIGRIAAGAAHEINNPLSYVIHSLDHAKDHLPAAASPDVKAALEDALTGARRIRRIVQDLKTFGRPASDELGGSSDLGSVLDQAIRIAASQIKHHARLARDIDVPQPVVGDEGRLVQVFLNLLLNAAQALDEERQDNLIEVRAWIEGEHRAVVEVRDTGCGIAPEAIDRVTEPFFTTKPVGVGSGLGLSVSRNIVARHGGELTVRSTLGEGTTVRVELPLADEAPAPAPPSSRPAPDRSGTIERIVRVLLVDDDHLVAKAATRLLKDEKVVTAGSGEEALALLAEDDDYDLVLCDLMMPGLSGMDVHERIVDDHPHLLPKLAYMSGGAFTERSQGFVNRPDIVFLEKPISKGQLRALVERARRGVPLADEEAVPSAS